MPIPYGITFHPQWWHKNAGICFSQAFFDDPAYRIDCDLKMRKALYDRFGAYGIGEKDPKPRPLLGTDLLAAGFLHSQLMGCKVRFSDNDSPQVICRNLSIDAVASLPTLPLDIHPVWQTIQRQIEWLLDKYGYVQPHINLMGVQNVALDVLGQELFLSYYSDSEAVQELLARITALSIDVGRRLYRLSSDISDGVTQIVQKTVPHCYLTSNCSVEMISNDFYEEFLLPCDLNLSEAFPAFGVHHCGQTMEHIVAGYAKLGNRLIFAEAGAGSNLTAVRAALPSVHLNARFSPVVLATVSPAALEQQLALLVQNGCDHRGERISVSCVGIDAQVSSESICAFLHACQKL